MALISLVIAALLSAITVWLGVELSTRLSPQGMSIVIDENHTVVKNVTPSSQIENLDLLLSVLQIALPILFFVIALLATVFLFYRWKLKDPLKILMDGANHIIENDLNFSIEAQSTDELGQLCTAFETMRQTLRKNNRELWQQAEERKRLNTAFSHELNVLFEIAENLISNAVRFAKQTISVNLSFSGDMLHLEVTDDGSGFPAGLLKNGIQPFQKGNEDAEHFGMGLYLCDLLCKKHGGFLEIKNCGQGAFVRGALKIS